MSKPVFTPKPLKPPFSVIHYLPSRYGASNRPPSAIDRLAALGAPAGAAARHVEEWDQREEHLRDLVAESVRRTLDP